MKQIIACVVNVLLWTCLSHAQGPSLEELKRQAGQAWEQAQEAESALRSRPETDRTRNDYVKVVRLYERVYLTTPHSGYSDDALIHIATLYEDTEAFGDAVRTLKFLISDYPASSHIPDARDRLLRLTGEDPVPSPPEQVADNAGADLTAGETGGATSRGIRVEGVRYWEEAGALRVVVDMDGAPAFRRGSIGNPPRVYLDIRDARLGNVQQRELTVDSVILRGIRVAQFDPETVRVVLDLSEPSSVDTFTLTDPNRLVIDVLASSPAPAVASVPAKEEATSTPVTAASPVATASPAPELPPPALPQEATPVTQPREVALTPSEPALPTENGDRTLSRILGLKPRRVVIDPGHGGFDPGTIGPSGLSEAELVLDIARLLKQRIERDMPNTEVLLTRSDDSFVPLEERPGAANEAQADLFISIHANSSQIQSIRGFETYTLNLDGSEEENLVAARENASSDLRFSDLQNLVQRIMEHEWVEESREFAGQIQKALASGNDLGRDRGIKQAPLIVLVGANMPSALAEISFISNPEDELRLKGSERRQEIADALFQGIQSYFGSLGGYRTAQVRD
jgi:N-acetylmuramoyl-L-alanine amidase